MSIDRLTRVNELLRREIGTALFQMMHEADFDMAAVTITHVIASHDLRTARVLVSIRDHPEDREHMLRRLRKHRRDIQDRINRNLDLKYTPRLTFQLDSSVEQGHRVLDLLEQLEEDA
jgi:ribosome-binding factor A